MVLRSLPILALAIAVWLIVRYVRPEVYDIAVPADFSGASGYSQVIQADSAGQFVYSNPHPDSITCSQGLLMEQKVGEKEPRAVFSQKKSCLPLEWIGVWTNGFMETIPVQTVLLEQKVGPASGIFKENFEGSEIVLRLEQKKPRRIVALWENYAIKGETNGEIIKIQIPAAAAKLRYSLIRVWCCSETSMSPVCEIPLAGALVATQFKQVSAIRSGKPTDEFQQWLTGHIVTDSVMTKNLRSGMEQVISSSSEAELCLAFGDRRFEAGAAGNHMAVCNYFGRKILVLLNTTNKAINLDLPVKGDFKNAVNNSNFNQKGSHLKLELPANMVEILY